MTLQMQSDHVRVHTSAKAVARTGTTESFSGLPVTAGPEGVGSKHT